MRRSLLLVAMVVLGLVLPAAAAHAIVQGVPDDEHHYVGAFVGTVLDPRTGREVQIQFCTGTLLASDVVLSAAHCFVGLEEFGLRDPRFTLEAVIDADRDGLVDRGTRLLTGTPVPHESFGSGGRDNPFDLAVFLLDRPVTRVAPAALPALGLLDRPTVQADTFVAVGYGLTRTSRRQAFQAFEPAGRRLMAEQQLRSTTAAWASFSMNEATGDGGSCYGDSGGPHLRGDVVVSITVTGDAMCKATDKSYRLDTRWSREFLARFVDTP